MRGKKSTEETPPAADARAKAGLTSAQHAPTAGNDPALLNETAAQPPQQGFSHFERAVVDIADTLKRVVENSSGESVGARTVVTPPPTSPGGEKTGTNPWTEFRAAVPGITTTHRTVTLQRAGEVNPATSALWMAIAAHTDAVSYASYEQFIEDLLCNRQATRYREDEETRVRSLDETELANEQRDRMVSRLNNLQHLPGGELYELLRTATEAFLLIHAGVFSSDSKNAPKAFDNVDADGDGFADPEYDRLNTGLGVSELESKLTAYLGNPRNNYLAAIARQGAIRADAIKFSPFCANEHSFVTDPLLLELIWSYWMEEGMLTQTTAAITRRFQNVRRPGPGPDPLGELELHPLRGMSGFLWGYLRDEPQRLSLARRAYEYSHQYGLTLWGRAVPQVRAADPRPRFLEAFHNLLRQAARFYREDADTTVIADAFPVLNSIREVHLVLAEGAHNQFRDLPWTARVEMLMQQWLLARPEMREFLRGRQMVPYPEGWMGSVDAMKRLQGWGDTSVIHFRDLARFGERLLLSIRYGNWTEITSQDHAVAWLRYWKEEVQGYIHSYFTATGVNLSDDAVEVSNRADVRYVQPSYHLRNRLLASRRALNASR
ncbi:MAG: hypothetical protein AVDCRST_MAG89-4340 [uncultured Gemmatimonadetes bacterium]|uniref:Uncharacterized protein n=1 Tax=uncultured Gemmatimonadota bacterium TaxID=203437 RepID=A0A6J4MWN8_9BACT|nr:MAG: hypothetical protein AVDCRST_MAG89-4340 [uncultured Gemmatimonadota bacterium]